LFSSTLLLGAGFGGLGAAATGGFGSGVAGAGFGGGGGFGGLAASGTAEGGRAGTLSDVARLVMGSHSTQDHRVQTALDDSGSGTCRSPRHRMPLNSRNDNSKRVDVTRRATAARPYKLVSHPCRRCLGRPRSRFSCLGRLRTGATHTLPPSRGFPSSLA